LSPCNDARAFKSLLKAAGIVAGQRAHYAANLMSITPKASWPWVKALLHSVYDQPDATSVHAQFDRVVAALAGKAPRRRRAPRTGPHGHPRVHRVPQGDLAPDLVEDPNERLNREIRRRTDVVGIFPDRASIIRQVGAVLAEQHDEWAEGRRYLGLDVPARAQTVDTNTNAEVDQPALQALTA